MMMLMIVLLSNLIRKSYSCGKILILMLLSTVYLITTGMRLYAVVVLPMICGVYFVTY